LALLIKNTFESVHRVVSFEFLVKGATVNGSRVMRSGAFYKQIEWDSVVEVFKRIFDEHNPK